MNRKERKLIKFQKRLLWVIIFSIPVIFASAFLYIKYSSALGGAMYNNILFITKFQTNPVSPIVWDRVGGGNVSFDVSVRGRTGTVNYYMWSHCPNYNSSTVYNVASMEAVCGGAAQTTKSVVNRITQYDDNSLEYIYNSAGVYQAVLLVERSGVFAHKAHIFELKPLIDVYATHSSNGTNYSSIAGQEFVYHPAVQKGSILYNDFLTVYWKIYGVIDTRDLSCTAIDNITVDDNWKGVKKQLEGSGDMGRRTGGQYTFALDCTYNPNRYTRSATNLDSIIVDVPPLVELTGYPDGMSLNPQTATQSVSSEFPNVPLNAAFTISGAKVKGAKKCTLSSTPDTGVAAGPISELSISTEYSLSQIFGFASKKSDGLTATTDFKLTCEGDVAGLTSQARIRARVSKGNCGLEGNNQIEGFMLCTNSITTLNGGDNIELKGAFASGNFSIDNNTDNIRFFYDFNKEEDVPPGFRYLNIPNPTQIGNK